MFGAIEAGGTKMVVAVGDEKGNILSSGSIATTTPDETIPKILDFFKDHDIEAVGIGAFGPVCLDRTLPDYGRIGQSPKLSWVGFSWIDAFKDTGYDVVIDTDVNVAALGEAVYGSGRGLDDIIYVTIGTGIGVGVYLGGKLLHGMLHPEAGHILIERNASDTFEKRARYDSDMLALASHSQRRCLPSITSQKKDRGELPAIK